MKNKSALFCIGSPLQAICALEALKYYNFQNYQFKVINDGARLMQIENFLNCHKIKYEVVPLHPNKLLCVLRILLLLIPFRRKYDYLVLGDFRLIGYRILYLPLLNKYSNIIYLDDGNYIIDLVSGKLQFSMFNAIRLKLIKYYTCFWKIKDNILFTFFADDIESIDSKFTIVKNDMSYLHSKVQGTSCDVYVIGTNPIGEGGYCQDVGLEYSTYLDKISTFLEKVKKTSKGRVYYIPHGRDKTHDIRVICNRLDISYVRPSMCIESYIISLDMAPGLIYGFGSTSLYLLLFLCPNISITNITFKTHNKYKTVYDTIASLYEKKGINNIMI